MTKRKPKNNMILIAAAVGVVLVTALVVILDPISIPVFGLVRITAVLGYLTTYLAVLSSLFMKELVKTFGRPFIKVHHIASITSLAALMMHGVFAAFGYYGTLMWLIPNMEAPQALILWLMMLASLAALLRKTIGKNWKIIHWLNYLVFIMATLHANAIGTNFTHLPVQVISYAMALSVIVIFVLKHLPIHKKKG